MHCNTEQAGVDFLNDLMVQSNSMETNLLMVVKEKILLVLKVKVIIKLKMFIPELQIQSWN